MQNTASQLLGHLFVYKHAKSKSRVIAGFFDSCKATLFWSKAHLLSVYIPSVCFYTQQADHEPIIIFFLYFVVGTNFRRMKQIVLKGSFGKQTCLNIFYLMFHT